jgi:hypothetical protein
MALILVSDGLPTPNGKLRLGLQIIRLKENVPALDHSSFHRKLVLEARCFLDGGLAFRTNH